MELSPAEVTALRELATVRQIGELLTSRAVASDRRDPPAMLAMHTTDGTDEHGTGREPARTFIERIAATAYRDPDNGRQRHLTANLLVEPIADDQVAVECYHLAYHRHGLNTGPTDHLIGGRYVDRLRHDAGRWLIDDRTVVYDWSRSTPATTDEPDHPAELPKGPHLPMSVDTHHDDTDHDTALLAELLAKQAITEVLYRRARAGDRRDHALALTCYHPGATEDHEGFTGTAEEFLLERSAYAPGKTPPGETLMHLIANVLIELDGDEAFVESYHLCLASGGAPDALQDTMIGGRYLDRFARRDGRWAITHRTVAFDWSRVEPATTRFWDRYPDQSAIPFGRMDGTDPLYRHVSRTAAPADGD